MTKRSGYKQKFEEKMLPYLCPSNPLNLDEEEQKQNKLAFFCEKRLIKQKSMKTVEHLEGPTPQSEKV